MRQPTLLSLIRFGRDKCFGFFLRCCQPGPPIISKNGRNAKKQQNFTIAVINLFAKKAGLRKISALRQPIVNLRV